MNVVKRLCLSLAFVAAAATAANAQLFTRTRDINTGLKEVTTVNTGLGMKKTHKDIFHKMFERKKYVKTGVGASLKAKRIKLCAAYR